MRAVIQRVSEASVTIGTEISGRIGQGILVFLGIEACDEALDIEWLCAKIINLRIFNDDSGIMNNSILDSGGNVLIVSQFTLHASTKKGNRPSYIRAAKPEISNPLYNAFIQQFERMLGKKVHTGKFGAMMNVSLVNDGPVTIIIDTRQRE
ncbi:MAG: D-aminoacyl-tRNA deacylase [Bacteroidetes bacterium]|nr:D-aminoacyl-tRNA deacylase [Bacteroidota bacterium]